MRLLALAHDVELLIIELCLIWKDYMTDVSILGNAKCINVILES